MNLRRFSVQGNAVARGRDVSTWPASDESANLEQVRLLWVKHAPVGTPTKPAPGLPASRSARQSYPRACVSFRRCSRRDLPAASFLRIDQGGRDYGQRAAPSGNVFERRKSFAGVRRNSREFAPHQDQIYSRLRRTDLTRSQSFDPLNRSGAVQVGAPDWSNINKWYHSMALHCRPVGAWAGARIAIFMGDQSCVGARRCVGAQKPAWFSSHDMTEHSAAR
jgi:hypothetical protein